jgi:hypothetical protein
MKRAKRKRFAYDEPPIPWRAERQVPIPRWMRRVCRSEELTIGEAVSAGALTLAASALWHSGGARRKVRLDSESGLQIRADYLAFVLCDLPRRLYLPIDVAATDWGRFSHEMARRAGMCVPEAYRNRPLNAKWLREVLIASCRPEVIRDPKMRLRPETPFSLMESAYRILQESRTGETGSKKPLPAEDAKGLRAIDVVALLMIDVARRFLPTMFECRLCFRWSRPGYAFCSEHGQAEVGPWTPIVKVEPSPEFEDLKGRPMARSYAHGRSVSVEFGYQRWRQGAAPKPFGHAKLARLFGTIIWRTPPQRGDRTDAAIHKQLASSPKTLTYLGERASSLKGDRLLALLRDKLDPLEHDATAWVAKLSAAETWFACEARLAEKSANRHVDRQKRSDFLVRVKFAEELAKAGLSQAEIARQMLLSRSTFAQWLARGVAPRLFKIVAQQRKR